MDIRTVKTYRDLRNAYMELASAMMPSDITVALLCKTALVNKTTFYRHYKDIYEYADKIEQEAFDKFLTGFESSDKLLSDPSAFLTSLLAHMNEDNQSTLVFRGKQDSFLGRLANFLSDTYLNDGSSASEVNKVTFIVGGLINSLGSFIYTTDRSVEAQAEFIRYNSEIIRNITQTKAPDEVKVSKQPQRPYFSDKSFWK
ncbi:MAG: TetR/AcrR family transcriptional regulator [Clostridiales bacterium]|nr:TetR/AcrR family transcriptional regulator [Clostridiales bacterium]